MGAGNFLSVLTGVVLAAPAVDAVPDKINTSSNTIKALSPFEAEQERLKRQLANKPEAYVDKVMDSSTLPAVDDFAAEAPPNDETSGMRAYLVETRAGFASSSTTDQPSGKAAEFGLRGEYRQETLNYGEYDFQVDTRYRSGDANVNPGTMSYATEPSSQRVTLRNLAYPVTPDVFADTSLGDINTEVTSALARRYRLSLGSSVVRGAGTHVYGSDFDLRAGMGERGLLVGGPYPGFEKTQGSLAWLGYSHRLPENFNTGVQLTRSSASTLYTGLNWDGGYPGDVKEDITSVAAAIGYGNDLYEDGDKRARFTLVQSQSASQQSIMLQNKIPQNSLGIFVDGGLQLGRYRHEMGVYSAQPNLSFGDYTLASDNRGAYWRVDSDGARLNWGLGLDYEQQNPEHDPKRSSGTRLGSNANLRYRISRDDSVGGSVTAWSTQYDARASYDNSNNDLLSLNANAYYQTRFDDWGRSRFMLNIYNNDALVSNGVAATGEEIQWEQDWITGKYETMRPELVTTLGYAYDRSGNETQTYPTAGIYVRHWFDATWHVGGNLRYSSRSGNLSTSQGLSGSVFTETELTDGWRMGVIAYMNQAIVDTFVNPFYGPTYSRSQDMSAYLYLRWEATRGTGLQALGLRNANSAGGGSIRGRVFFDKNRDDEQQGDELGVPGVEVWLDERYRVTTDRQGNFEFPMAATGTHQLSLQLESVPLPWGPTKQTRQKVDVPLRGEVFTSIPVVKVSD
jgi:hypothetical protein